MNSTHLPINTPNSPAYTSARATEALVLEQDWDVPEFNKGLGVRPEGPRRQCLGASIWLDAFLPALETRSSGSSCPACTGEHMGILQRGSCSIIISSVRGKQTGSSVEERRLSGL